MGDAADSKDEVQRLIAEGELLPAAERLCASGRHAEAADLYERVALQALAARCARHAGDRVRAHGLHLAAGDRREAARDRQAALEGRAADERASVCRALAEQCLRAGRYGEAAALLEEAGDGEGALRAHERSGDLVGAARVLSGLGRDTEAADLLERWLGTGSGRDGAGRASGTAVDDAALELARVELRLGRHAGAVSRLQGIVRRTGGGGAASGIGAAASGIGSAASGIGSAASGIGSAASGIGSAGGRRREALSLLLDAFAALGWPAAAERTWLRLLPTLEDPPADWRAFVAGRRGDTTGGDDAPRLIAGRYRLERLLGAGGAGQVHLATDLARGRQVAIKLLTAGPAAAEAVARLYREARIARSLDHPAIVRVLEADPEGGYIVMEYLPGGTLADGLRGGRRLEPRRVARVGAVLAEALAAAHRRGILHRDVKPENVLLDRAGAPRLADFGAAHLVAFQQTGTGYLLGTLAYMAPEQLSGDRLCVGTDLWGLAVTLYRSLTGALPFPGPDLTDQQHRGAPPPSSRARALGPEVDAFFARAFAIDPSGRFEDAEAFRLRWLALPFPTGEATEPEPEAAWTDRTADATPALEAARYERVAALGGRVSLAWDGLLLRHVVVERVPDEPGYLERVVALARAGNPSLQPVIEVDLEAQEVVYAHLDGPLLPDLATTPRSLSCALRLAADVARALLDHPGPVRPHRITVRDGRATVLVAGSDALRTEAPPPGDVRPFVGRIVGWIRAGRDPGATASPLTELGPAPPAGAGELADWLEARLHGET